MDACSLCILRWNKSIVTVYVVAVSEKFDVVQLLPYLHNPSHATEGIRTIETRAVIQICLSIVNFVLPLLHFDLTLNNL